MLEDNEINLFETIVAPLQPFINEAAQTIKPDSETSEITRNQYGIIQVAEIIKRPFLK